MSVISLPTCPTDCTGVLESVSFSECAPEVHFGEIAKLYVWVDSATPPFDSQAEFDSAAHWNTHLSEDADLVTAIRQFTVIGEQPEPEQTETTISGNRTVTGFKKFTVSFEIDETNETNYNFMLGTNCNGKYKLCYETADGLIFGGFLGIDASIKMNYVIPKERSDLQKIMGKAIWESKNEPFRQISILT